MSHLLYVTLQVVISLRLLHCHRLTRGRVRSLLSLGELKVAADLPKSTVYQSFKGLGPFTSPRTDERLRPAIRPGCLNFEARQHKEHLKRPYDEL